jgi:ATP-dependent exoDNAse (exonuclease V) alpha subunit
MVKNRDHWTIISIHRDRSVTVSGCTGTIRLPADYVSEHVELGYAQTSHATQGRTVDIGLLLVDRPTDSHSVYTAMTRGRKANHAYIVTDNNQTSLDILTQALARDWIDQPAIARKGQLKLGRRRHLQPPDQSKEDEVDKVVQRARQISVERHARRREAKRDLGRSL